MTFVGGERSFGAAQIDADEAADAFFDHGDAEQAVHAAHRHGVVGDDEVAGVGLGGHAVEEVAEALDVRVVEGRVDLVQDAAGGGRGGDKGEDGGDSRKRQLHTRVEGEG